MRWPAFLLCFPLLVAAQSSERERLSTERAALVQGFAAEERACRERFAVNACIEDVRQRRRAALGPLRERELQLADADRLKRAQERQDARAARADTTPVAPKVRGAQPVAPPLKPAPLVGSGANAVDRAARSEHQGRRAAEAAARVREAAQRAEAAKETRAEVARRQEQRKLGGKRSTPLPSPAASAGKP